MLAAARLVRRGHAGAGPAGFLSRCAELQHGRSASNTSSDASWVLVQRDGGSSTTAAGTATGAPNASATCLLLAACLRVSCRAKARNVDINRSLCTAPWAWHPAGTVQLERRFNGGGPSGTGPAAPAFSLHRLRQAAVSQLQATLMPAGYPDSVAPGYLHNTLWQAVHHCAGSANGGAAQGTPPR